jgi:hypothetical protein
MSNCQEAAFPTEISESKEFLSALLINKCSVRDMFYLSSAACCRM